MEENKQFWYCFSFVGKNAENGCSCDSSMYSGLPSRKITKSIIDDNRKYAGVNPEAVVVSISYLGRMTKSEFVGS